MFQKPLLILAIAAACTSVQAQSTPAKKELVARILKVQQPGIELMARDLVTQPLAPMLDSAGMALQQRVPADKRDAIGKEIQADARKYADETTALVRVRAVQLAPTTIGPLLEEKFTEDELKQVVGFMESPVFAKFQSLGGEMQRALVEKLVADTRTQVETRYRALEDSIGKRLGVAPGAAAPTAPATAGKPPAKK